MSGERERWSSRPGFILAAVGSAVGLGNMWRFSYLTAEHGGAAFVALYLVLTLLVGLPLLLAELVLGRTAQSSPIRAFLRSGSKAWRPLGVLYVISGCTILSYYGVIAGWTVRYAGIALLGFDAEIADRFEDMAQGGDAFGFHLVFMALTIWIVAGGVSGGIERAATLLMPILALLICGLALYAATLEGGSAGYDYYLRADFSEVLSRGVLTQAAGQAFFSLSVGMGAMLTFGSYLGRDHHLPKESGLIAAADIGVAFLAGLVVFPLIFALGLSDKVTGSTVGALFITLPQTFAEMGGVVGRVVGFLFFAALVVGALTSAISLLEVVVSSVIDLFDWSRTRAAWVMGCLITLLGVPSAWSLGVLDVVDQVANNLFLLGGGLLLSIFVGWVMRDPEAEARVGAERFSGFGLWRVSLRFLVPVVLVFVLYDAVPKTLRAIAELVSGG
ncbi:sodium-dependent transporter [Myxococcota bacterium]|nr:sodium-dependent transporter [Myxococcota bacterium]